MHACMYVYIACIAMSWIQIQDEVASCLGKYLNFAETN